MARHHFLDIYFCQKQPRNSHFFRELGWALAIVETRFFLQNTQHSSGFQQTVCRKNIVLLQWYNELFKRVESTQEYMFEIIKVFTKSNSTYTV